MEYIILLFLFFSFLLFNTFRRFVLRKRTLIPPRRSKTELPPPLSPALLQDTPSELIIPHMIQPPSSTFSDRERELAEAEGALETGVLVISPTMGQSGLGCTELVRKLALRVAEKYPDGQIYIDLRGAEPSPLNAGQICIELANAWYPNSRLANVDPRAVFRGLLENRKVFVFFDNASDVEQVASFLPPAGSTLVIASRIQLDLPDVYHLELEPLSSQASFTLLNEIASTHLDEQQIDEIVRICQGVPLALTLIGKTLALRHRLTPENCIKRLNDSIQVLQETPVEAACRIAYDLLEERLQRYWPELAVFVDSFDIPAAASLWDCSTEEAMVILNRLHECGLIELEVSSFKLKEMSNHDVNDPISKEDVRYRLHELCRSFAADRIPESEKETVALRHASHYARRSINIGSQFDMDPKNLYQSLDQIYPDRMNYLSAQSWCSNHSGNEIADRICSDFAKGMRWLFPYAFFPSMALIWIDSALAAVRNLQDEKVEAIHITSLLEAYVNLGDAQRVLNVGDMVLPLVRKVEDPLSEAFVLYCQGEASILLSDYQAAERYLNKALRIINGINFLPLKARILLKLASIQKPDQGLNMLNYALEIVRQSNQNYLEWTILWMIANIYSSQGKHKEALLAYQDLVQRVPILGMNIDKMDVMYRIGAEYLDLGAPQLAWMCFRRSAEMYRRVGNQRGLAWALNRMGLCALTQSDFIGSQKHFTDSKDIFHMLNDSSGELNTLWGLGTALLGMGRTSQAIEILSQLLEKARLVNDHNQEYLALWQLAEAYLVSKNFDKAIHCFTQSLEVAEIIKNSQVRILALLGMSRTYREEGKQTEALLYCEKAKNNLTNPPDPIERALIEHATALVYDAMGDRHRATEHARLAETLYLQKGDPRASQIETLLVSWQKDRGLPGLFKKFRRIQKNNS
jgi:tetratricopeptide (TPR) repeat protein